MAEYWIADGNVLGAGDEGDTNHVQHVIDRILAEHSCEHVDIYSVDDQYLIDKGLDEEEIKVIRSVTGKRMIVDPREYAMKKWGWIRVANNNIQMFNLDSGSLHNVADGIWEIFGGDFMDEEDFDAKTYNIEVVSSATLFMDIPYSVIKEEDVSLLIEYRYRYAKNRNWYRYAMTKCSVI